MRPIMTLIRSARPRWGVDSLKCIYQLGPSAPPPTAQMTRTTVTDMQRAIDTFRRTYPEYAHADSARDQCKTASARFCDILIAEGVPARNVYVDEIAIVDGMLHYGALVKADGGCVAYDFTARQFKADAPWPVILGVDEEWDVVPQSYDVPAALTCG
jgi:hypothetical protein